MIDMAQADRTLYTQSRPTYKMSWLFALQKASCTMGYSHYADVPDEEIDALKNRAREIREAAE